MLTVYVLKNRVGRYNYFYTKLAKSSFLCRFRVDSVNVFVLARFDLSTLWTHSGKRLRMCEIVCWWRKRAQIELCKNKNIDGFYTKTIQKERFCKLCVKIKKKILYRPTPFFNTYTVSIIYYLFSEYCACQHWNFTGYKKIKQRRISFVLGYLRMILWKISTAIHIKHRILATFN
jgi:hypothetical protein